MPVKQKIQQLNTSSLPPGTSIAFRDWLVRLNGVTKETGDVADGAESTADEAKEIAEAQRIRNDQQDVTLALHDQRLDSAENRLTLLEDDVDYLLDKVIDLETRIEDLEDWRVYMTRQKSEVVYSGISLNIPTTPSNLLTLLAALTPTSGSLAPFFNTATGRLVALNKNKDLKLKISVVGAFAGGTTNRSMEITFGTVVPDTLVVSRNPATPTDNLLFNTFFSVEEGDDITSPGINMTIQSNGSAFTATQIKLIATQ
ncbi:hypothetical protein sortsyn_58 [Escherichia phage sortsyn]|uniref:Sf6-type phage tail needle knob domain-containing protein n=1 Tax=Escherichia phage sortsyn TaxID=2696447 RepID=A0A6B9X1T4_9CAUD|nr:hypothetical protein sortsyn_58 [Escherichia phage sortsyn]